MEITILDKISGIRKYALGDSCNIYAEWYSSDDFVVEEILPNGTILDINNPSLKSSGFPGLFTHFVLIKKNIDLFAVMDVLSRLWNVPRSYLFFSGIKDKEAITVQRGCVFGVSPKIITKTIYPKGIKIYSPIRELRRIYIGEHKGNRFKITLYNLRGDLNTCIERIKRIKLLNFFGYQRFGIWKPITHIAGKLIINRKYRDALLIFLYEINPLLKDKDKILSYLRDGNYEAALKLLPKRKFDFEKMALRILIRNRGDNSREILKKIPSSYLRIFLEAYQAFLFNLVLSMLPKGEMPEKLPLVGYSLKIEDLKSESLKETLMHVLEAEGIKPQYFRGKYIKPYIARGGFRLSQIDVKAFSVVPKMDSVILSFILRKGSFATIVIREILGVNIIKFLLMRKNMEQEDYEKMIRYYESILKKYFQNGQFIKDFSAEDLFL